MKNRKIIINTIVVTILGLLGFGLVQGYAFMKSPGERIAYVTGKIAEKLALDAQQEAELNSMADAVKEKMIALKTGRAQMHEELAALARQEQINEEEINDIIAKKRVQFDDMAQFIGEQVIQFHAMLTPEQREKLATIIETHDIRSSHCRFRE